LAGGESGPVVVPGKPEKSPLVEAIKWESLEMPPTGKLSDSQIATLTEWIRLGAPMPKDHGGGSGVSVRKTRGVISDEDRQWWAFQPIRRPDVTQVVGRLRLPSGRNDIEGNGTRSVPTTYGAIDAFLLARMQAEAFPQRLKPIGERSFAG